MKRFMIVDDSLFQRNSLEKLIGMVGGVVAAKASNGRESVELYPLLKPDIVLMDVVMPEMSGVEAARKIIEMDRKAKIIFISSIGHDELVGEAMALGAMTFITKPYDFEAAAGVIKPLMEGP